MGKKLFLAGIIVLALGAVLGAQSPEGDFEVNSNGVITKYVGWDTEVVIPVKIGEKAITGIGENAFADADLTAVTIPEGLVTIGNNAFSKNKLTGVEIPAGVKTIGTGAFQDNQLTTVLIPEGVTEIGGNAFAGNRLKSITLPGSLTSLQSIFGYYDAATPETVILPAGAVFDLNILGSAVRYSYLGNGMRAGTYTTNMPYTEKEAEGYRYIVTRHGAVITAFTGEGTRIRIPAELGGVAVRAIDNEEVFRNRRITNILIPEEIAYIGSYAFEAG
jgi:hypothetical protein